MALRKTTLNDADDVAAPARPSDAAGWSALLQDSSSRVRAEAAGALASYPGSAGALGACLLAEPDERVRQALFTSLTQMADDAAVGALLPLLRSEEARLRNGAIEALSAMPAVVGPRITSLLHDADPDVRIFTVNLLGELRHEQVPAWLLHVLGHDVQVNVVAAAIEVLAEAGSPEHLPALRAARQRFAQDAFIGFACDMAIDRIEAK